MNIYCNIQFREIRDRAKRSRAFSVATSVEKRENKIRRRAVDKRGEVSKSYHLPPMILSSGRKFRRCLGCGISPPRWSRQFSQLRAATIPATDLCQCPTGCTRVPANNSRPVLHKATAPTREWTCTGHPLCKHQQHPIKTWFCVLFPASREFPGNFSLVHPGKRTRESLREFLRADNHNRGCVTSMLRCCNVYLTWDEINYVAMWVEFFYSGKNRGHSKIWWSNIRFIIGE